MSIENKETNEIKELEPIKDILISKRISEIRQKVFDLRSEVQELICTKPKDRHDKCENYLVTANGNDEHSLQDIIGTLTSTGVYMYSIMNERYKYEKHIVTSFYRDSLELNPRGLGMDVIPYCFCCGKDMGDVYSDNIAAFVSSKEQGNKIADLFKTVTGHDCVRIDYREHEPNHIQVKFGVCKNHHLALCELYKHIGLVGLINSDMINKVREM